MVEKTYKDMTPEQQMEYIRMKLTAAILQFAELCTQHDKDVNDELLSIVADQGLTEKLGGVLELKRKVE